MSKVYSDRKRRVLFKHLCQRVVVFLAVVYLGCVWVLPGYCVVSSSEKALSFYDKNLFRLLEGGRFEKLKKEISGLPEKKKRYYEGLLALYEKADYNDAYNILADFSKDKNFYAAYSAYMASFWRSFREKESEHFVIRYFPEDEVMVGYALSSLEKIRKGAFLLLGWKPADGEKVLVEIYPDKKSFALASTLGEDILEKSGTVGICKFNRVMILSPRNLALGYRWVETLAHEYTHFVVNRISFYNCPLWVHEGVARWSDTVLLKLSSESEGYRYESRYLSDFSEDIFQKAFRARKLIPFEKMKNSLVYLPTREDISLAFAQVSDFMDFLIGEYGARKLGLWLGEMGFSDEKKSFKKVYGFSVARAQKLWLDRLADRYKEISAPKGSAIPDLPLYEIKSEDELIEEGSLKRYVRLGDELRKRENFEAAYEMYKKAWDAKNKSPVVAVKMARMLLALGRLDEASSLMEDVIKGNRNYLTPYLVLGEISSRRGAEAAAKGFFAEAFEINPFYPGLADVLGR